MANEHEFKVEILTPRREFFSGNAEAVTVTVSDGEMTVLKNHTPMLAAIEIGQLKLKFDGTWHTAYIDEGFIEVRPDEVLIFVQSCEKPEEIDVARAEEVRAKALEKLRQKQSLLEYHQTQITLTRAMTRLRISQNKGKNM